MKTSQNESMAEHGPTAQDLAMMEKVIHEARRAIDAGKAGVAALLNALSTEEKAHLTLYVTLEPCLICLSAISFVGIKRVVYAALAEDANAEELIARGLTAEQLNPLLTRGPLELVPGVLRAEGRGLLARMGKLCQ